MPGRHTEIARFCAGAVDDHQVAPVVDQLVEQFAHLGAFLNRSRQRLQGSFRLMAENGAGQLDHTVVVCGPEQSMHLLSSQALPAEGQQLVKQ